MLKEINFTKVQNLNQYKSKDSGVTFASLCITYQKQKLSRIGADVLVIQTGSSCTF